MDILTVISWFCYIAEAVMAAICGALCLLNARKKRNATLFFYLLAGFYACVCMSDVFYLLTWSLMDYPFVFSPGDLSWIGAIFFLITTAIGHLDQKSPEQCQAAATHKIFALMAPAVCIAFNIAFICIYPEITFNYLLYGIPTVVLSYYSLRLILTGSKSARGYHWAVLVWIAVQLFCDLFSSLGWSYGYALPIVIFSGSLAFATGGIYAAVRREVGA